FELTKLVHGEEEATNAQNTARAVFGGAGTHENMPTTELDADDFNDGKIGVLSMMVKANLAASNGEARRLVQQGGVSINDQKITDASYSLTRDDFSNEIILKKGKKNFVKFILK
ncbi:MAG: tyrosine--tRNA ligase, partial [Clostridia bacterium]|nr:tyrosine--tRNA ligase [Clostridia bacterium]